MLKTSSSTMMTRLAVMVLAVVSTLMPATTLAEPSPPAVEPLRQPPATPSAESEYNRGVRARLAKDWSAAEKAFRAAIALRAAYPEAWNDLGYALRNQGRYADSLRPTTKRCASVRISQRRSSTSAKPM